MTRNAYWISQLPGTAKIVEAPSANIARRLFAKAELLVFPKVTISIIGLEQSVANYVHEYLNADCEHIMDLTGIVA